MARNVREGNEKTVAPAPGSGYASDMTIDEDALRLILRASCKPSASAWASRRGVSATYISSVLLGQRRFGPKLLRAMGYRRVVRYEKL